MNQFIIYGAGKIGKLYYRIFELSHMKNLLYAFCDKNYAQIKKIGTIPVYSYEELKSKGLPFIIGMAFQEEVCNKLQNDGQVFYESFEKWIKDYIKDETDRIKVFLVYRNIVLEKQETEGTLNNLDKDLYEIVCDLELDRAVKLYKGFCPCCREKTLFLSHHFWLRDHYKCLFCGSIPRQRALMKVMENEVPGWRELKIHESSPSGSTFSALKQTCAEYSYSYWYEEKACGEILEEGGHVTNQNLENLTFPNEVFDIFITQDVLEHVNNPKKVFREISRVLKRGGIHVFTTPLYPFRKTRSRIKMEGNKRKLILPPIYHGNPISEEGSLVTYEWGYDFLEIIDETAQTESKIIDFPDSSENYENGLEADFLQVIVTRKIR